jgi:hypothetical protein
MRRPGVELTTLAFNFTHGFTLIKDAEFENAGFRVWRSDWIWGFRFRVDDFYLLETPLPTSRSRSVTTLQAEESGLSKDGIYPKGDGGERNIAPGYRAGKQFTYSGWSCFNAFFVQAPKP